MATPTGADLLLAQLRHTWSNSRWIRDGLTDEEYQWEPIRPCWSLRPRAAAVAGGWGKGDWVVEDVWPPPDPVPVTTIAWRLCHLTAWTDIYRRWTFTDERPTLADQTAPGTAAEGVQLLIDVQDAYMADVATLTADEVFDLRPAHRGESLPIAKLVTLMLAENIHHVAELGVLRDLRRGHASRQPLPRAPGDTWWTGR
jgi:hypothetical protein